MIFILALLFSLQVKKENPIAMDSLRSASLPCVVLSLPCVFVVLCVFLFLLSLYLVQYAVGCHLLPQLFGSHACVNARRI